MLHGDARPMIVSLWPAPVLGNGERYFDPSSNVGLIDPGQDDLTRSPAVCTLCRRSARRRHEFSFDIPLASSLTTQSASHSVDGMQCLHGCATGAALSTCSKLPAHTSASNLASIRVRCSSLDVDHADPANSSTCGRLGSGPDRLRSTRHHAHLHLHAEMV